MKYSYVLLAAVAAVSASPVPGSPSQDGRPSACSTSHEGTFAVVVERLNGRKHARQAVSQIADGQVQAPHQSSTSQAVLHSSSASTSSKDHTRKTTSPRLGPSAPHVSSSMTTSLSMQAPVTQIGDGQIEAPGSQTMMIPCPPGSSGPLSSASSSGDHSSSDSSTSSSLTMKPPVTQISDGQVQAPPTTKSAQPSTSSSSSVSSSSAQLSMKPPVSQIADGQVQAPTTSPHSTSTSRSTSTTTLTSTLTLCSTTVTSVKSTTHSHSTSTSAGSQATTSGTAVSIHSDGQLQVPTGKLQVRSSIGACKSNHTLTLSLTDGVLKDARAWQGYIASNHQFQFDKPPQAGALSTSGFSICSDGNLALNGNNIFYECLSGDFYNLYDHSIAKYCDPVHLQVAQLVKC